MTPIDILAVVFSVIVLVKLAVVIINPGIWMKLVDPIYRHTTVTTIVYVVLLAVAGYYVLPLVTAVQFGAIALIVMLIVGLGFIPYANVILKLRDEVIAKGIGKAWFSVLVWFALAIWVLVSAWK
ncbi:MAG: hypothetical protein NUV53_02555 [Patescibacteria group bacterium]|nr:hypothetical protein [Patescibacteria group bacterium]